MGDRVAFGFKANGGDDTFFLYGHWAGYKMLARFADGLREVKNANRLHDAVYGTRIAVDYMTKGEPVHLGWGFLVNQIPDDLEHKVPVVDFYSDTVTLYEADASLDMEFWPVVFETTIPNFISRFRSDGMEDYRG